MLVTAAGTVRRRAKKQAACATYRKPMSATAAARRGAGTLNWPRAATTAQSSTAASPNRSASKVESVTPSRVASLPKMPRVPKPTAETATRMTPRVASADRSALAPAVPAPSLTLDGHTSEQDGEVATRRLAGGSREAAQEGLHI